jgi:hypothetical protein
MLDPERYERFFRVYAELRGVRIEPDVIERLQDELMDSFCGESEDEWEDIARTLLRRELPPETLARALKSERAVYGETRVRRHLHDSSRQAGEVEVRALERHCAPHCG